MPYVCHATYNLMNKQSVRNQTVEYQVRQAALVYVNLFTFNIAVMFLQHLRSYTDSVLVNWLMQYCFIAYTKCNWN